MDQRGDTNYTGFVMSSANGDGTRVHDTCRDYAKLVPVVNLNRFHRNMTQTKTYICRYEIDIDVW